MIEIKSQELIALKSQGTKLENRAQQVTIKEQADYLEAIDIVAKLKDYGSTIKSKKESITKPLNDALKNVKTLFAPLEEQLIKAEAIIKVKLLGYKQQKDEEARLAEQKIAEKVEAGRLKLETAEKKLDNIERVETTTRGNIGEVQIRKIKKVRIIDEALLPREYLEPNLVAIRRDALGGKQIPGTEVYDEEIVAAGNY